MFRVVAKTITFGTTKRTAADALASTCTSRALLAGRVFLSTTNAATDSTPSSVKDLLINLTFVDPSGARRKATGIVGKFY